MMHSYSMEDLGVAFRRIGISAGRTVLVHSSLFALGSMKGVSPRDTPAHVFDALRAAVGEEGTIVVPSFTFAFCRGEPYDPETSPSEDMGVLSEYVRLRFDAVRSRHAMQSVAAVGRCAADICAGDPPGAFGKGGAFDKLLELDARILLIGAAMQAVSFVHTAEQNVGVPYRRWKSFEGAYRGDGGFVPRSYDMYARDLKLDPRLNLSPIGDRLTDRQLLAEAKVGSGWVRSCRARAFVDVAEEGLREDPLWLVIDPDVLSGVGDSANR